MTRWPAARHIAGRNDRRRRSIGAVWLVALVLAGCTAPSEPPATEPPVTAPTGPPLRAVGFDQERITVALVVDVSGPGRQRGQRLIGAADAFWAGVAADGGIGRQFPVEPVVLDSQGDPEIARQALSAVVNDVAAVALVDDPVVAEGIRPILGDHEMLAVTAEPTPAVYADELRLPVGLGVAARVAALAELLAAEAAEGGAWCPVGDGGSSATELSEALAALDPTAPLADPVVLTPESDLTAVATSLATCAVVWLPGVGGGRDAVLDALAAASHPGRVAVVADEIVLSEATGAWAPGHLVLATSGPDWSAASPAIDEMVAVIADQSPGLAVGSTTALGWTAQEVMRQILTGAFERGSFDRSALLETAGNLDSVDSVVSTWTVGSGGERMPSGPAVVVTPGPGGVGPAGTGEVVGVVESPFS